MSGRGGLDEALLGTSSAIQALESSVGVFSGNVTKSDTVGAKGEDAFFRAELSGVSVGTTIDPTQRGNLTRGQNKGTYVAIDGGDGVLPVAVTTDQKAPLATSDGSFERKEIETSLGKKTYLVNRQNMYLMAVPLDPVTGQPPAGGLALSNLAAVELKPEFLNVPGAATTGCNVNAILPSTDLATIPAGEVRSFTQEIYGSRGVKHQLTYSFTKVDQNTWDLDISFDGGASAVTKRFVFNDAGTCVSISPTAGPVAAAAAFSVNFDMSGSGESAAQAVSFDMTKMTLFGSQNAAVTDVRVISTPQIGGKPVGSIKDVAIKDGFVEITYTNDTKIKYYQVIGIRLNDKTKAVATSGNAYEISNCRPTAFAFGTEGIGTLEQFALENASGSKTTNIIFISKNSSSLMMEYGVLRKLMQNLKGLQELL